MNSEECAAHDPWPRCTQIEVSTQPKAFGGESTVKMVFEPTSIKCPVCAHQTSSSSSSSSSAAE